MSTDVLGRVVEIVSGMPLDAYFSKAIFSPLGLNDTHFHLPADKWHRLPVLYAKDGDGPQRPVPFGKVETDENGIPYSADLTWRESNAYLSGSGGLCSTASDYMKFCQMLLNGGELDEKRLLRPKTVEAMRTNQISSLSLSSYKHNRFGFGFRVIEKVADPRHEQMIGVYGWGGFFETSFLISPKGDWILIVMTQRVPDDKSFERELEFERRVAIAVQSAPR